MAEGQPKKRTFRKYSYRGVDLDKLVDMSTQEIMELYPARKRRKFSRGIRREPMMLLKRLRKAKLEAPPKVDPALAALAAVAAAPPSPGREHRKECLKRYTEYGSLRAALCGGDTVLLKGSWLRELSEETVTTCLLGVLGLEL